MDPSNKDFDNIVQGFATRRNLSSRVDAAQRQVLERWRSADVHRGSVRAQAAPGGPIQVRRSHFLNNKLCKVAHVSLQVMFAGVSLGHRE